MYVPYIKTANCTFRKLLGIPFFYSFTSYGGKLGQAIFWEDIVTYSLEKVVIKRNVLNSMHVYTRKSYSMLSESYQYNIN